MKQSQIIDKLTDLVHSEHCTGCDSNTCDVQVAYSNGFGLWAVELFRGCGAASEVFDALYEQLGPKFRKEAEKERQLMCELEHVSCPKCNAVLWLPEDAGYFCDSCCNSIPKTA